MFYFLHNKEHSVFVTCSNTPQPVCTNRKQKIRWCWPIQLSRYSYKMQDIEIFRELVLQNFKKSCCFSDTKHWGVGSPHPIKLLIWKPNLISILFFEKLSLSQNIMPLLPKNLYLKNHCIKNACSEQRDDVWMIFRIDQGFCFLNKTHEVSHAKAA